MQTSVKAAQMTLPGGRDGRSFHPSIVQHSKDAYLQHNHIPDWSDRPSVLSDKNITCYESMVSIGHGAGYYQDLEDAWYFRKTVSTPNSKQRSKDLTFFMCIS